MVDMPGSVLRDAVAHSRKGEPDDERRALAVVDSPFAVGLKYAFHDAESSRLVLVIDLMMGGDLKYWLSQHKCFGFEASRYYAARTLLGLKALHDRDFVYRDVKPENMLVLSLIHI